jgi:hypothetical protein
MRWLPGPAAVLAATLVAGCGAGSPAAVSSPRPSASESASSRAPLPAGPPPGSARLLRQINAAVATASSVHISAARLPGDSRFGVNLSVTRSDDMSGNIIYKRQPLTVLVTRGHGYLMVNSVSLQVFGLPSGVCSVACGEYAAVPVQRLVGGISWHSLVGTSSSLPTAQLHYLRTVMVNGEPAWEMRGPRGAVIYVAARGAPYPLRVMDKGKVVADLTHWNSATVPPLPPGTQVIPYSQFKQL